MSDDDFERARKPYLDALERLRADRVRYLEQFDIDSRRLIKSLAKIDEAFGRHTVEQEGDKKEPMIVLQGLAALAVLGVGR